MTDGLQLFEPRWTKKLLNRIDLAHNGTLLRNIQPEQLDAYLALWAGKCTGLTADQVKHGIAVAERMTKPPTPSEFRLAAIGAPAHQVFKPLPKPKIDPEKAAANMARVKREMSAPRFMRRTPYRKDYDQAQHRAAIQAMLAAGFPAYRAEMQAMAKNGWTEACEQGHRLSWAQLPGHKMIGAGRLALYSQHDAPPDWILRASHEQAADIDRWIETGELPAWAAKAAAA